MAVEVMRIIRNVVRPKNTLAKLKELEWMAWSKTMSIYISQHKGLLWIDTD
jgi:hypothetical protein